MRLSSRPAMVRIAVIDREIRDGRLPNATSLAQQLEVNSRTVHRDLDCLRDQLGAPLQFDRDRNGYYYTNAFWRIPLPQLSEGELVALFLAERLLHQYKGTPFAPDLARMFQKITAILSDRVTLNFDHLAQATSFRVQNTDPGAADQFRSLLHAVENRHRLELLYWSASRDETLRRVVDPYHLASIDGDWFLIAYCHLREEIRMFSPGRIRELGETGATFDPPADFRAADYLDAGFRKVRGAGPGQTVRLFFNPAAARWVREKTWHATQTLDEHPDGSLTLTFFVNHLVEVKRWVLSFGGDCEVLEPDELLADLAAEIRKMVALAPPPRHKESHV